MGIVTQNALVQAHLPDRLAKHPSDYVILLMIALWMDDGAPGPLSVRVRRFLEETPYKRITVLRSLKRLDEQGIIHLHKQSQRYDTGYDISLTDSALVAAIDAGLAQQWAPPAVVPPPMPLSAHTNGRLNGHHALTNDQHDWSPAPPGSLGARHGSSPERHGLPNDHHDHSPAPPDGLHAGLDPPPARHDPSTDHHARSPATRGHGRDQHDPINDRIDPSADRVDRSRGAIGGQEGLDHHSIHHEEDLSTPPQPAPAPAFEGRGGYQAHKLLQRIQAYRTDPETLPAGYPLPTDRDHALSFELLTDFDIGVSIQAARVIARILLPIDIFEQCLRYRADLEAGKVGGQGVLLHRLAHMRDHPPQTALHPGRRQNRYFQRYHHHFDEYAGLV